MAEDQDVFGDVLLRAADSKDVTAIAELHADSWRRHYRGAYSDAFLDGDLVHNRQAVWSERLDQPPHATRTIVVVRAGAVVGFAHTILHDDAVWGALIENVHVTHGLKRHGIGSRMLAATARTVADDEPPSGMYLWVLEQNAAAQAFYEARGGLCVGREAAPPPGGDQSRLRGRPVRLRYAWEPDLAP